MSFYAALRRTLPLVLMLTLMAGAAWAQDTQPASAATTQPTLTTQLQVIDGRPTLLINGQKHDGLFCSTPADTMKNFIDAGFDIFDTHPGTNHGWVGPNQYDYTGTDRKIEAYLSQKRDAKLIIRIWMGYPYDNNWWVKLHPDQEVGVSGLGSGKHVPSYASLLFRQEAGEALRRVVTHIEGKYGNNVIAYVPGCGSNGECFHWHAYAANGGPEDENITLDDYSKPMLEAYRKFVQQKYGTIAAANAAYGTKLASFEELQLPTPEMRVKAKAGNLRDAGQEKAVLDYYEIFNRQVADTMVDWAAKVKEACGRRKVVMMFYGYQWVEQPNGGMSQARSGHVDLDEILSCPDVDYVVAPFHYSYRQMDGVFSGQGVVSSAIHDGKQYVHEMDGSTCLRDSWPCQDHSTPRTPEESGQLLSRDMNKTLMEGSSCWYMDLAHGMYNSPEMVAQLKAVLEAGRKNYFAAGKNNRQVAVVLDSRDAFYFRENEPLRAALMDMFKQFNLEVMGLGYDDLTLDNLRHLSPEQTAQYKFWIFPSLVHVTDEEIQLIRQHAQRNGNRILWVYAAGVVGPAGLDLARMEKLTGFRCGYTLEKGPLAVRVLPGEDPLLAGRKSPIVYGTYGEPSPDLMKYHSSKRNFPGSQQGMEVTPRFFIENAGTSEKVLGNVLDIDNGQHAGLAVKDMGNWVSMLSVAPMVPVNILRNLAASAGCHVYTSFPGQLCQSEGYVSFFAHDAGECTIKLPVWARITNAYTGEVISEGSDQVTIDAQTNGAILFKYEPVARQTVTTQGKFELRINCGCYKDFRDDKGQLWHADRPWAPGLYGYVGGLIAEESGNYKIANTDNPTIYQTHRHNLKQYRAAVPNGNYKVTLHFAETYGRMRFPGGRSFDVQANGQTAISNLDVIVAAEGWRKAASRSFDVTVTNGELTLDFVPHRQTPMVSAIEIVQQ